MAMVDCNLIVGPCPFRDLASGPEALTDLRREAGWDRAVATGFRSLFYHDPISGLKADLEEYRDLSDWLYFWAVIDPSFPQLEAQVRAANRDGRIAGIRLLPTLHRFSMASERCLEAVRLAGELGLPVNLTARVFDGRVAPRAIQQSEPDRAELVSFLEGVDGTRIVLSMFFFPELKGLRVDWSKKTNVYLDLGCCKPSSASFDELASWFPVERVVFGTGAPFYYWKGSRLALEGSRLSETDRTGILGGHAMEIFPWK